MGYNQTVEAPEKTVVVLGYSIIPKTVREAIGKAGVVQWGTHLLRWRYFEVTYEGVIYHRDTLIPTALWHLLKRIFVDQEWPTDTTLEILNEDARATIRSPETEIYVSGLRIGQQSLARCDLKFFLSIIGGDFCDFHSLRLRDVIFSGND